MNTKSAASSRNYRPGVACIIMLALILSTGCNLISPPPAPVEIPGNPTPVEITSQAEPTLQPARPSTQDSTATDEVAAMIQPVESTRVVTLPDPATAVWREFASGLSNPVDLAAPKDGAGRLFVVEQTGRIQTLINGQVQPEPFLDISNRISTGGSEQGLLGLALHPDYNANGFFFVNYTDVNGDTVIARYRLSTDPNKADPASELILLHVEQPFANHNGGSVRFGPDGYLYLGLGDGGSGGDPQGNGQNPDTLLGKILRIDVNQADGYSIPPGNLYPNGEGRPEIFATGLRNPWRFSFDPFNGDLYIGDVGQNLWEEIDLLPAAPNNSRNFGWNFFEGAHEFAGLSAEGMELIPPVWEYDHNQGCSVTGGVVYYGQSLPAWKGVYLFADYCSGLVWGLLKTPDGFQSSLLYQTGAAVSSFGEDASGEVYLLDLNGRIYRLEPAQ
jgi:glucose/arabinose dehydrogenase